MSDWKGIGKLPTPIGEIYQRVALGSQRGCPKWWRHILDNEWVPRKEHRWMDHSKRDGDVVVFEPYGESLSLEDFQDLVQFAEHHQLEMQISAVSHHYPTRTLHIRLYPAEKETEREF